MLVTINGEKYVAETITQFPVNPLSGAFRTTGVQQRADNIKLNRFVFAHWQSVGIGSERLRRHQAGEHGNMRDADAETRFGSAITLPLLNQSETHADPADHLITYEHFKGDLRGLFEQDFASGAPGSIVSPKYVASTDTWTGGTGVPVFNAASTEESSDEDPSITGHTVQSTYGNRLLIAVASPHNKNDGMPTAVTWNGVSMTEHVDIGIGGGSGFPGLSIWYLVNPATGNRTLASTWGAVEHQFAVMDFYHVDQTSPVGTASTSTSQSTSVTLGSIASKRGDLVFFAAGHGDADTFTPTSGQTEITDSQSTNVGLATTYERATASTTSCGGSWASSEQIAAAGFALQGGNVVEWNDTVAAGVRHFGSTVHKGKAYAVIAKGQGGEGQYQWYSSSDGEAWSGGAGTNWPTTVYVHTTETRKNDWTNKFADIIDNGATAIVALYEDPDSSGGSTSQIHVGYSANEGTAWTFDSDLVIPCTDTPNIKLVHFNDLYTAGTPTVPVLITSDNIYKLTITAGSEAFQEMLPRGFLSGTANEALAADVASDGALYLSKASGDILRVTFPGQGVRKIENVGPQSKAHYEEGEGLVTARQGHANFIYGGDPRWLFVCYGGHAGSKNASILAMDYGSGAWHSFYRDSTADQDCTRLVISTEDDGTARLHAVTEGAATAILFMFEEPLVSAVTGATQSFKTSGYVEWSEDDLADPHTSAAVMRALVDDAGTLGTGTTKNYVALKYGTNGGNWDATTLGNFLSSALFLNFDTSNNRGISAKTLRVRLELEQQDDSTTTTPQIREFEIQARNRVTVLRGWQLLLNLAASAEFQSTEEPPNPETVIANLTTVQNSVTLVGMTIGEQSEAEVEMTSGEWTLRLIDAGGGDGLQAGRATGTALVTMEEVE